MLRTLIPKMTPKLTPKLFPVFATTLIATLGGLAAAQDLSELLPEETFLALGMQDLNAASDKLADFSSEFERLGVGDALLALAASSEAAGAGSGGAGPSNSGDTGSSDAGSSDAGSSDAGSSDAGSSDTVPSMDDLSAEQRQALETLSSLDVLGQEAWIALSASPASPLPALTLVTRVTPEGAEQVQTLLDSADTQGVAELEESGTPFFQLQLQNDSPVQVLAYSLSDDLLVLSSNPDELRGVLRRHAGADEPNFAASQGYEDTLATLDEGTFYGFLNYARIADVAAPYAQNLGFDPLVTRLSQALATAGSVGSVITLTDDGATSEGFQAVDRRGGDAALYNLLSSTTPATTDVSIPEDALTFSASAFDLGGWYDYLNELSLSVPELGGDLDSLILSFTGLSLRESVLSWAGEQFLTVTTGLAAPTEPGVPSDNLLGEQVFMLEATNDAAAQRGLDGLFQSLGQTASSLADPEGGAGAPQSERETIAGAAVTRYDLAPGASVWYAVSGGYALIGTSQDAVQRTLEAQSAGGGAGDLFADVPSSATSYTHSDDQATYQNLAQQLSSQLQTAAGMGGAAGLDFGAVEQASNATRDFLTFVSTRLSDTTSYTETTADGVRSRAESEIDWTE